jgi:endonuclease/exonuclease/phosphatase (EEP) superfamily protein YafD
MTRAVAWCLVALAVAALAFGWLFPDLGDDGRAIATLNWLAFMLRTFTPHAGVILLLLALLALLLRCWRPAAAKLALAACCVVPMGLAQLPRGGASRAEGGALTVMSCNLEFGRADVAALLAEIDAHGPDVLVLQEYTPEIHERIGARLSGRFAHSAVAARDGGFGMAVYSCIAFGEPPVLYPALPGAGGAGDSEWVCQQPQIRVVVRVGGREVVVQGVHTLPPLSPSYLREQRRLVRALAAWVEREARPVILAGDFNHTMASPSAGWMARAGLVNTHAAAGKGVGNTWPDGGMGGLWRVLGFRLDHVFVGRGVACEWAKVAGSIGTDHRPVVARVGVVDAR